MREEARCTARRIEAISSLDWRARSESSFSSGRPSLPVRRFSSCSASRRNSSSRSGAAARSCGRSCSAVATARAVASSACS
ncbi:MAG: hypothetical protein A3D95_14880 [Betaproteobacteria bacterium RIFCSPHIGHO2_12_FULL_69_13]|nr:MAG: hypothetical protein A3D95_14880 [Betaproteobacteria bacterium RIFCSPHIGHO2_12_FULL_69_13]